MEATLDVVRRATLMVLLVVLAASCGSSPLDVAIDVRADGVRFPVDGDAGDDPYTETSGRRGDEAVRRTDGRLDPIDDVTPPGRRPPTANICGVRGVIETGPSVQFPWAPPCVRRALAPENPTARGVTKTTIKVAYYITGDPKIQQAMQNTGGCGTPQCHERYVRGFNQWFSRYFETYGRRVVVEPYRGAASESNVSMAEADATALADAGYFAVLGGPGEAGSRFASTLADRGVLCVCTVSLPESFYEGHAPYVWSWLMSSTQAYIHRANYVTQRLAGRKAAWAGTSAMRARDRSFGLVWFNNTDNDYREGVEFFEHILASRGVDLAASVSYVNIEGCQTNASSIVTALMNAEVTSVIFAGDPLCPTSLTSAAQARGATWEWIVTGSVLTDTNNFGRLYDQTQWRRAFGVSMLTPDVANPQEYWARMLREVDPAVELKEDMAQVLHPFVPFFTGVHMAGPNLTVETFARGLRALPASGGTVTIPRRSYGRKTIAGYVVADHTSYDDMTEIWWDPDANGPDGKQGAYRYVARGRRYAWDGWPSTAPAVFRRADAILGYARPPDQ